MCKNVNWNVYNAGKTKVAVLQPVLVVNGGLGKASVAIGVKLPMSLTHSPASESTPIR